jgi:NAD(P)-dependent dehydrogenase (short-subunit alcohol dehydrogenase family)
MEYRGEKMTHGLEGKTALVTGATRGIGKAIAEKFISEGARVIATGTKPDGQGPDGAEYMGVDFADADAAENFSDRVVDLGVDILVNNAGINKNNPFARIVPEDFERIQRVNVHGPFLLCRAVLPGMKDKGWGRIVNIGSVWGKIAREYRGAYAASKFALDGMTAALAAEVAEHGILANSVAPGFIDTELTRTVLGPEAMAEMMVQVPMKRFGKPEEIATFVAFLASSENTYISGQNIAIDGGFTRV